MDQEKLRREREQKEYEAELKRRRERRARQQQQAEADQREQELRQKQKEQGEAQKFAEARERANEGLKDAPDSGGAIHDVAPKELGKPGAARNTGIRRVAPEKKPRSVVHSASKEAGSARQHGADAVAGNPDAARDSASKVFDTYGRGAPGNEVNVGVRPSTHQRPISPEVARKLAASPEYQRLSADKQRQEARHKQLEVQLGDVRRQKTQPGADKGRLDVEESKIKQEMSVVKSKADTDQVKMDSFIVNFEEEAKPKSPNKRQNGPPPPKS